MTYTEKVLADLKAKNPDQPEFIQAATEVLDALAPVVEAGIVDGSLQVAEPTAFAEVVALLANLWLSPLVFADGPEKRKQKLAFLCTLCEPTGLDLAPLQPYLDQL